MHIPPPPPAIPLPIASVDCETYSEAGYLWDGRKWGKLPHAGTKVGIKAVSTAVYAEHPSTDILNLWYDLFDGLGRRGWSLSLPLPEDLFNHVRRGGLVTAYHSMFEYELWNKVGVRRYGFPPLPLHQMRCTMARARGYALPGPLGLSASVLRVSEQKSERGTYLINRYSIPRNPTKKDPRLRITPWEDLGGMAELDGYCSQDVAAEDAMARALPPMRQEELDYWLCDQKINARGVHIDRANVENIISILEQAIPEYDMMLNVLTEGAVPECSKLKRLQGWLHTQGVHAEKMDEDTIEDLVQTLPDGPAKTALTYRQEVGSAAVKKVFSIKNHLSADDRLRNLYVYNGARTGRPTGEGPQPTNLPNSGPSVYRCDKCGAWFGDCHNACPVCLEPRGLGKPQEWNPQAAEFAIDLLRHRSYHLLKFYFGNGVAALKGCIRPMFIARPGYDLISSDFSAIEAMALAEMAGESWRQEVFRTHGKIYEESASRISGVPFEEFMLHYGYTKEQLTQTAWWEQKPAKSGSHHKLRKTIGKVAELACFAPGTLVLTDRGYVDITDVLLTDKLWDGVEWVNHEGVVSKGSRPVINLDGVKMTPTHPIRIGSSWREARKLASNESALCQALETGSANLPLIGLSTENMGDCGVFSFSALAAGLRMKWKSVIFGKGNPLDVILALRNRAVKRRSPNGTSNITTATKSSFPIENIGDDSSTVFPPPSVDATILGLKGTPITGGGGFLSTPNGSLIKAVFYGTLRRCKGGTTRLWKWIGSTLTGTTSRGIFGSFQNSKTVLTKEAFKKCNEESTSLSNVYDIVNAGPRHRFTIKTNSGHLLVHNSGYQGWIGAWLAFGAGEFMTEAEIKQGILAWRAASPAIVELWGGQKRRWKTEYWGFEGMFVQAILNPGYTFSCRGFDFTVRDDVLHLRLLSGRTMYYHRPRLTPGGRNDTFEISYEGWNTNKNNGAKGWVRMKTWGGRMVENATQAVCNCLFRFSSLNVEAAGYPIVLHTYDEITSEVPEGFGSVEEFERIMALRPSWAADWPIRAAGGWRGKRYRK